MDFNDAINDLNQERQTLWRSAAGWKNTHPTQKYTPPPPSSTVTAAEEVIKQEFRKRMDLDGLPYNEGLLSDFVMAHRLLGWPFSVPTVACSEFIQWQNAQGEGFDLQPITTGYGAPLAVAGMESRGINGGRAPAR